MYQKFIDQLPLISGLPFGGNEYDGLTPSVYGKKTIQLVKKSQSQFNDRVRAKSQTVGRFTIPITPCINTGKATMNYIRLPTKQAPSNFITITNNDEVAHQRKERKINEYPMNYWNIHPLSRFGTTSRFMMGSGAAVPKYITHDLNNDLPEELMLAAKPVHWEPENSHAPTLIYQSDYREQGDTIKTNAVKNRVLFNIQ